MCSSGVQNAVYKVSVSSNLQMLWTNWFDMACRYVFDYHPGEVYWCTADIGWITGHSYITYGPLANGATSVLVS